MHEIESEDYSLTGKVNGLLSEASLELDGPLSRHPALRDMSMTVGETVSLAGR